MSMAYFAEWGKATIQILCWSIRQRSIVHEVDKGFPFLFSKENDEEKRSVFINGLFHVLWKVSGTAMSSVDFIIRTLTRIQEVPYKGAGRLAFVTIDADNIGRKNIITQEEISSYMNLIPLWQIKKQLCHENASFHDIAAEFRLLFIFYFSFVKQSRRRFG